mmetsp:Transcript_3364/g.4481  ORF Transcript_3364/g.4481 Transcript_3364/m.4481 type:complete len:89 (-) Transcript_3364:49-315(-)
MQGGGNHVLFIGMRKYGLCLNATWIPFKNWTNILPIAFNVYLLCSKSFGSQSYFENYPTNTTRARAQYFSFGGLLRKKSEIQGGIYTP